MKDTFLRLPKVKQLTGFGRSQIYHLIKQGKFPKQIHIGPKSVAWLDSEVSEWMKERIRLSRNDDTPGKG
ncbi:MAG: AlpA family transcriptional regulator [Nitrospinae bacterium]|nr:AlpA family transcriptional regulator [Nitrospinota bacterium]